MRIPGLLVLMLIGCGGWLPASPAQDRDRPEQTKGGRLVGLVMAADTGRPIMRAQVGLIRVSESRPSSFAFTNDAGLYAFEQVPEGRYTLVALKPGLHLEAYYGRTTPDTPPKVVTITAGTETHIDISMPRAGAISGRVFDERGEPLPYASVVLARPPGSPASSSTLHTSAPVLSVSSVAGFTRVAQPGSISNDRGEFRLFGLAPGEYMFYASAQAMQGDKRLHAPVYYPGVFDAASAERIRLLPGQEIANLDFTLRLTPRVTVSGIALSPEGDPMRSGSLSLHPASSGDMVISQIGSIKTDGSFSFETLPGQYVLRARWYSNPARPGGFEGSLSLAQALVVGTDDITGVVLKLTHGAGISGRFAFEGSGRPADTTRFSVSVQSGGPGEVVFSKSQQDGTFAVRGIESGPRRVSASASAGWMLKGIYLNGRDIADQLVDFTDDTTISGVSVVFTDVLTRVQLSVQYPDSEKSSIVVVFPDDSGLMNDRRIAVRPASSDALAIEGLPAGEYLAVAISDAALGALERPDARLLERLRTAARKFEVADGASVSVTLRAMPLPR